MKDATSYFILKLAFVIMSPCVDALVKITRYAEIEIEFCSLEDHSLGAVESTLLTYRD